LLHFSECLIIVYFIFSAKSNCECN